MERYRFPKKMTRVWRDPVVFHRVPPSGSDEGEGPADGSGVRLLAPPARVHDLHPQLVKLTGRDAPRDCDGDHILPAALHPELDETVEFRLGFGHDGRVRLVDGCLSLGAWHDGHFGCVLSGRAVTGRRGSCQHYYSKL